MKNCPPGKIDKLARLFGKEIPSHGQYHGKFGRVDSEKKYRVDGLLDCFAWHVPGNRKALQSYIACRCGWVYFRAHGTNVPTEVLLHRRETRGGGRRGGHTPTAVSCGVRQEIQGSVPYLGFAGVVIGQKREGTVVFWCGEGLSGSIALLSSGEIRISGTVIDLLYYQV